MGVGVGKFSGVMVVAIAEGVAEAVAVGVGVRRTGEATVASGVVVAVAVKVGQGVKVLAGMDVDTRLRGPLLMSNNRQACKKAANPAKPTPLRKCRLFIWPQILKIH